MGKATRMDIVKVNIMGGRKHQNGSIRVTIPKDLARAAHIEEGLFVRVCFEEGRIVITPMEDVRP